MHKKKRMRIYKKRMMSNMEVLDTCKTLLPPEIFGMVEEWTKIFKSPYGDSFYDQQVTWTHKPDGSYRVADHWNFQSKGRGKFHCETNTEISNDTHWSIGKWDEGSNKYVIILSIKK